ncbi:MAG: CdaR family protein [Pyrinomonadaceae bacterium]
MSLFGTDNPIFFNRRPRGLNGWLRAIFIEDWGLKLLALAITLFLWFSVAGQRTTTTVPLRHIPLSFRYASDLEITGEPREVDVTVTGSKQALDHLNSNELVAVVDISNLQPGDRSVPLNRTNVTMNLPDNIRLDLIEPKSIPIRLEPRRERQLELAPKLVGNPAPGFEVRSVSTEPGSVMIRGAASRVNAVAKAETEPLSIEGLKADRDFPQTMVTMPDARLTLIDTVVNVTVRIGEKRIERTFTGIKVAGPDGKAAQPNTATVLVYGDRSVIETLRTVDLQIMLDIVPGSAPGKRLVLPPGLNGRVELRSTKPAEFSLSH